MVDYKKSGKTEQCLTLALLMKEDLFTFDDEEIEAGRLLFAGPCDFIAAAQNLTALPPISLPEIAFAGRFKCWQIISGKRFDGPHNTGQNIANPRPNKTIDLFFPRKPSATC